MCQYQSSGNVKIRSFEETNGEEEEAISSYSTGGYSAWNTGSKRTVAGGRIAWLTLCRNWRAAKTAASAKAHRQSVRKQSAQLRRNWQRKPAQQSCRIAMDAKKYSHAWNKLEEEKKGAKKRLRKRKAWRNKHAGTKAMRWSEDSVENERKWRRTGERKKERRNGSIFSIMKSSFNVLFSISKKSAKPISTGSSRSEEKRNRRNAKNAQWRPQNAKYQRKQMALGESWRRRKSVMWMKYENIFNEEIQWRRKLNMKKWKKIEIYQSKSSEREMTNGLACLASAWLCEAVASCSSKCTVNVHANYREVLSIERESSVAADNCLTREMLKKLWLWREAQKQKILSTVAMILLSVKRRRSDWLWLKSDSRSQKVA